MLAIFQTRRDFTGNNESVRYYFPVRLSDVCLSLCQTLLLLVRHGCANRGRSHDEYQCSMAVSGVGESYSKHPDGGKNRLLSSVCPAEEEEGGMKGKHDLAPMIFPKVAHSHHTQSKDTWDALGAVWGVGGEGRLIIPELL